MVALRSKSIAGVAAWLPGALLLCTSIAGASSVQVTVLDHDNAPVEGIAVFWRPPAGHLQMAEAGTTAVMDQVDTRFVPHVLIVQTGTSVEFPNSDTVAHHVYSFSHPNQFKLPIYKGDAHPPVTFAESGIVILGCNIHDNMLGYILVVDSPAYGKTDKRGVAHLTTGAGDGDIVIWSPRIRDRADALEKQFDSPNANEAQFRFTLSKSLRPAFDEKSDALSWSDY